MTVVLHKPALFILRYFKNYQCCTVSLFMLTSFRLVRDHVPLNANLFRIITGIGIHI